MIPVPVSRDYKQFQFPWHFSFFRKGADYGAFRSPKSSAGMDFINPFWGPRCFSGTSTVQTRRGVIKNAIRDGYSIMEYSLI